MRNVIFMKNLYIATGRIKAPPYIITMAMLVHVYGWGVFIIPFEIMAMTDGSLSKELLQAVIWVLG